MKLIIWTIFNLIWNTNCSNIENEFGAHFFESDSHFKFYGVLTPLYYTIRIPSPVLTLNKTEIGNTCRIKEKDFREAKTKMVEYFSQVWEHELDIFTDSTNSRRSRRFVGLALGLAGLLVSFFLSAGVANHFDKKFEAQALELDKFKAKVASELTSQNQEKMRLLELICEFRENGKMASLIQFLTDFVRNTENIVLSLTGGILPTNRAIFSGLKNACFLMQPAAISEARKAAICNNVLDFNFSFEGITLDENRSLLLHLDMKVPILTPEFSVDHRLTKIYNVGYYHNYDRNILSLPNDVININDQHYNLDITKCKKTICPFSALSKTPNLNCFMGLKVNDFSFCKSELGNDVTCLVEQIPHGYLILAKSGVLVHKNKQYPEKLHFSAVVTQEGHLFCSNDKNISFVLPLPGNQSLTLNEFTTSNLTNMFELKSNISISNSTSVDFKLTEVKNNNWLNFVLILGNSASLISLACVLLFNSRYFALVLKTLRHCVTTKTTKKMDAKIGPSNRNSFLETIQEHAYKI